MSTKETRPRRQQQNEDIDKGEKLSQDPVEIPLGMESRGKTMAEQIQDQIAIQLAKKDNGVNAQTPEQIRDELMDLEDDSFDDPLPTQYEYTDMRDALFEGVDYPDQEEEIPEEEGAEIPPESAPPEPEQPSP